MVTKKTQKVKINAQNVPTKDKKVTDNIQITEKEKKALDSFFEKLRESVQKTADEMGLQLHCKETHSYYVSYSGIDKSGDHAYGCSCFSTDLNVFERHGYGIRDLAQKFEEEKDLKSVIILNVIKLED